MYLQISELGIGKKTGILHKIASRQILGSELTARV